jgi:hypothetical protein
VAGLDVNAGEQAGDAGVFRVGGVELFEEGRGLGDFGGVARVKVGLGELRGEAGVAGMLGERGGEQGLRGGGVVLGEQDADEGGGCGEVVWGGGEIAAIGLLGGGQVVSGDCDLGGEQDVRRLLGGELERGEEMGGGGGGVGWGVVEVEAGKGAEGAGLESRLGVRERGGGGELGAGFGGAVGAGEQQAEGDARGGEVGVGGDGGAVAGLGRCWLGG